MINLRGKSNYSIAFILICCMACGNSNRHPNNTINEKAIENIRIICDSIHLFTQINSFPLFFHIENPSNYNILLTINKQNIKDNCRKSFLLIGPNNDTLPIYDDDNAGYRLVKAHTSLYFTLEMNRVYFMNNSIFRFSSGPYFELIKQFIKSSKMIYISDSAHNDIKEFSRGINTMFLLKNKVLICTKNMEINTNFTKMEDWRRLYEKKNYNLE